jgi:hypothetical protein
MSAPTTKPDARFRPFRAASWAFYLFVAVGYSGLVIYSVTKSVFEMSPDRPVVAANKPGAACVAGLRTSFDDLETRRQKLGATRAVDADQQWLTFRNGWMKGFRQLEAECTLDEPDRAALKESFARLERVMDLSTVQATQVASQLGPSLEAFRAGLAELERQP